MGMGGGSGGGGTSGAVSWPTYFQDWHTALLGTGTPSPTVLTALNTAMTTSPYTGVNAYDPTTDLAAVDTAMGKVLTIAEAMDPAVDWAGYVAVVVAEYESHVYSSTDLTAAEAAYNAVIDAEYNNVSLPRFQRGMQDVNAVLSSAYAVGTALLEAEIVRKKATFSSELRLQNHRDKVAGITSALDSLIKLASTEYDYRKTVVATLTETKRIKYVAKKEETDANLKIDEMDAKWDLDILTMGGNILAAGHGGVSGSPTKASPIQSALGGAMSGAAMGGMAAGAYGLMTAGSMAAGPIGWGIGLGAVLGGALGLFG